MALLSRFRQMPPSASGRQRHDVSLGFAEATLSALFALSGQVRKVTPPEARETLIPLTVTDRTVVARDEDVVALTLVAADGTPLPRWYPGAHLDVHLPSGLIRQYSLCGEPAAPGYRIAVRRIPGGGGGSVEVHDGLPVGATVRTHGPRNAFPLAVPGYGSPGRRLRFVAGGIGITPILPMLAVAQARGVRWSMVYTGRSRDSLPFLDEIAGFGDRVTVRTDDTDGVPTPRELLGDQLDGTCVYACGPAPMLTVVRDALSGRTGVELHFERFASPPVVDGSPFTVAVASTGVDIPVGSDETLLAALRRAGVDTPYSCQQGFCGTCRTRVLDGVVEHRDTLLTEPERGAGMMLTCVSRAAVGDRLTLDL
ncbi:PDR/VanB family oxidoreductase [Mycolicibacterium sp. F2034L]|uniref:PDR/VanB family oxidoreductase n=1 Tax=Mycolicibacterium sp. F2034L TaxID=2926422 RepID=UPI001FF3F7BE|nr:PDR/VanB family oxidoreductase [Mycolicibacterium sp. F2034L]MCK0174019.1 PDR/VanB family oxidoreductase [Mycolicibacterium sp. F2034L]